MELCANNIHFRCTEMDLTQVVAHRLHRPPFSVEPLINFLVTFTNLPGQPRQAVITFPEEEVATLFLSLFENNISVHGKILCLSQQRGEAHANRIDYVRSNPWKDPDVVQREKEPFATKSELMELLSFQFGRFCRDGPFSAEADGTGCITCDLKRRKLHVVVDPSLQTPDTRFSFSIHSSHIVSMAFCEVNPSVLIECSSPPRFQSVYAGEMPARCSFFCDIVEVPPITQAICLTFRSRSDMEIFLARACRMHIPDPFSRELCIVMREIYSLAQMKQLHQFMKELPLSLAFEIDKAIRDGLVLPREVLVNLKHSVLRLKSRYPQAAADIFRNFVADLPLHGLKQSKRKQFIYHRRRGDRGQGSVKINAVPMESCDLNLLLENAVWEYLQGNMELLQNKYKLSPDVYSSFQLVITPTRTCLQGPLLDRSNSVLRKYQADDLEDCFLRISFQDEDGERPRRDSKVDIDQLLGRRYRAVLFSGLRVAGRNWFFLAYSMSGLKEYSFVFMRPFVTGGEKISRDQIRRSLGNFRHIKDKPALLGARWSQAFSASTPSVALDPDQIVYIPDRESESCVFTDGCGTISSSLIDKVWKRMGKTDDPPSCIQFRLGGAKGVLVDNPCLRGDAVCLRPSQKKFDGTSTTLDITTTSARPIPMFLNRPLIALLEHLGVPYSSFLALQKQALNASKQIQTSFIHASNVFEQHGLGQSFRLTSLLRNIQELLHLDRTRSNHSRAVLRYGTIDKICKLGSIHIMRDIKHRARIFVPGSFTLIGVSDEWNCLREGEIYARVYHPWKGIDETLQGKVLITRPPQIHPGDVQYANAVCRRDVLKKLGHLKNVVVFSCRGKRSLPSCLGGGDLDGDVFNLIIDQRLFPPRTAAPAAYIGLEHRTTENKRPCGPGDVVDFIIDYIKSDVVGPIATRHLRIADLKGYDHPECLLLAEKASHAVDFSKVGVPVVFRDLPVPPTHLKPDFLSGEGVNSGANFYPSQKALGRLYRNVRYRNLHRRDKRSSSRTDCGLIREALSSVKIEGVSMPSLLAAPATELMEQMEAMLDEYCRKLMHIARTHTISTYPGVSLSEAEIVTGTSLDLFCNHKKRKEYVASLNLQTRDLCNMVRQYFDDDASAAVVGDEPAQDTDGTGKPQCRATLICRFGRCWAAWLIANENVRTSDGQKLDTFGAHSFGLLALSTMLETLQLLKNPQYVVEYDTSPLVPES